MEKERNATWPVGVVARSVCAHIVAGVIFFLQHGKSTELSELLSVDGRELVRLTVRLGNKKASSSFMIGGIRRSLHDTWSFHRVVLRHLESDRKHRGKRRGGRDTTRCRRTAFTGQWERSTVPVDKGRAHDKRKRKTPHPTPLPCCTNQ